MNGLIADTTDESSNKAPNSIILSRELLFPVYGKNVASEEIQEEIKVKAVTTAPASTQASGKASIGILQAVYDHPEAGRGCSGGEKTGFPFFFHRAKAF